jgi:hypothetical protein
MLLTNLTNRSDIAMQMNINHTENRFQVTINVLQVLFI